MNRNRLALTGWLLLTAACTFNDRYAHCVENSECATDQSCYRGFCVVDGETGTGGNTQPNKTGGKGGSSTPPSSNAGESGTGTVTNPSTTQDSGSMAMLPPDAGSDGATMMMPSMPNMPSMDSGMTPTPTADCKAGEQRECSVEVNSSGTSSGCGPGKQSCENGKFGSCVPTNPIGPDVCNGRDDDCNGTVDDGPQPDCYLDGVPGCPAANSGGSCVGLCAYGKLTCRDGKPDKCEGAKTPQPETCTTSGTAADENCDGATDENCDCRGSESRSCYTGPQNTSNVGTCVPGTQTCSSGKWGVCTGSVTPQPENCANQGLDNDCDGRTDNIRNLNVMCAVTGGQGICAAGTLQCTAGNVDPKCVSAATAMPETCNKLDDDCDGTVDDGIDLTKDPQHCGSCEKSCGAGEVCCSGNCANIQNDVANCGACGAPRCAAGSLCCSGMCTPVADGGTCTMPNPACSSCAAGEECCDNKCVNTKTDRANCGGCGGTRACATGLSCCSGECKMVADGGTCEMPMPMLPPTAGAMAP